MIKGKKWTRNDVSLITWALSICGDIWQELTGTPGSFTTRIAYIKKTTDQVHRKTTSVCTVNFDGSEESTLLKTSRILIAPTWNTHSAYPIVFYSEFTNKNVRIMGTNTDGYKWPVIDIEGTNLSAACSPNTKEVLYCRSGDIWQGCYNSAQRKTVHTLMIHHNSSSASPAYLSNGDILYCNAGTIKQWNIATQKSFVVIKDGYCVAPNYHAASNMIVYSKRVKGCMQLCTFDLVTQTQKQLTVDAHDKTDPSWSPCGMYIAYCLDKGNTNEIHAINILNKKRFRLSPAGNNCICPAWSPVFTRH